jgi:hypothetical protein
MVLKGVGFLACGMIAVACEAAPAIIGNSSDTRCIEAREMAQASFRSLSPSLLWPVARPTRRGTRLILTQASEDISGGRGIDAGDDFGRAGGGQGPTVLWRTGRRGGPHLAVVDQPFNWRGDWYAIYILPPKSTADGLLKALTAKGPSEKPEPLLGDNRWAVPLVLNDRNHGRDWIIDRGEPHYALADWQVYEPAGLRLKLLCRISFGVPRGGGLSLLLPAVRRFAAAADEALGSGNNEGTLNPTGAIRVKVEKDWANAALRPWALNYTPYNTRAEINRGLDEWAKGNRKRLALRRRIKQNEIDAERALAAYYVARFGKSLSAARKLSRRVLDHNLRDYFVFSKSG